MAGNGIQLPPNPAMQALNSTLSQPPKKVSGFKIKLPNGNSIQTDDLTKFHEFVTNELSKPENHTNANDALLNQNAAQQAENRAYLQSSADNPVPQRAQFQPDAPLGPRQQLGMPQEQQIRPDAMALGLNLVGGLFGGRGFNVGANAANVVGAAQQATEQDYQRRVADYGRQTAQINQSYQDALDQRNENNRMRLLNDSIKADNDSALYKQRDGINKITAQNTGLDTASRGMTDLDQRTTNEAMLKTADSEAVNRDANYTKTVDVYAEAVQRLSDAAKAVTDAQTGPLKLEAELAYKNAQKLLEDAKANTEKQTLSGKIAAQKADLDKTAAQIQASRAQAAATIMHGQAALAGAGETARHNRAMEGIAGQNAQSAAQSRQQTFELDVAKNGIGVNRLSNGALVVGKQAPSWAKDPEYSTALQLHAGEEKNFNSVAQRAWQMAQARSKQTGENPVSIFRKDPRYAEAYNRFQQSGQGLQTLAGQLQQRYAGQYGTGQATAGGRTLSPGQEQALGALNAAGGMAPGARR